MAFYIDGITQIHDGLTETVRTVQKTRPRNGKEPCFTILSAIIGVEGTNEMVGRGGVWLVSLRYVSDDQACSRAAGLMRDAYGWDRIVLHCHELFLYTGFLKLAILLNFFFWDTLDGSEISRPMGVCAIGDGESVFGQQTHRGLV